MPEAGRLRDNAHCPADSHGCPACAHAVTGPAVTGSDDVQINALPALRVGDHGTHAACCGPNEWQAVGGAPGVFINRKRAHRKGDATAHCGGDGTLIVGSNNVIIGDLAGPAATAVAHDRSMEVSFEDAFRRSIGEVTVRAVCPHHRYEPVTFHGSTTLHGLCEDAAVLVLKRLELFDDDDDPADDEARR